jgi:hypothetical protein
MKEQPFLCSVDERTTWGLDKKMIEAKAFRTFIRVYPLFRSESLSANIKLALHKGLLMSIMTYTRPWLGVCDRCALISRYTSKETFQETRGFSIFHVAFELLYVTKLCRQQARKVIQKRAYVGNIRHKDHVRVCQAYGHSNDLSCHYSIS